MLRLWALRRGGNNGNDSDGGNASNRPDPPATRADVCDFLQLMREISKAKRLESLHVKKLTTHSGQKKSGILAAMGQGLGTAPSSNFNGQSMNEKDSRRMRMMMASLGNAASTLSSAYGNPGGGGSIAMMSSLSYPPLAYQYPSYWESAAARGSDLRVMGQQLHSERRIFCY